MDQVDYEALLEMTAQFQLVDIEELRSGIKGKGRSSSPLSDIELAYSAVEAEARATLQFIQDRRIARSAERASQEDVDLINVIAEIERREQADRQYALSLSTNPNASPPSSPVISSLATPASGFMFGSAYRNSRQESPSASSNSSLSWSITEPSQGSASSRSSIFDPPKPQASSSISKSTFVSSILRLPPGRPSVDCVICADSTTQAYQAPCGCFYDRQCLRELFDKATIDESLFPPRCCSQQISFAQLLEVPRPSGIN
ncbi:unnamed protein product [Rhizoctonia solani]|uniref:RING-type domain-containing protein n=1 Tax=Rhizoctonia solani TaxID=456999 RepID=A0A8H3A2S1_9AGAM|nr:unnamed protein product [Rhizoctonia solani]